MACAGDGIKGLALGASCHQIEMSAHDLGIEDIHQRGAGEPAARWRVAGRIIGQAAFGQPPDKGAVDRIGAVKHLTFSLSARWLYRNRRRLPARHDSDTASARPVMLRLRETYPSIRCVRYGLPC